MTDSKKNLPHSTNQNQNPASTLDHSTKKKKKRKEKAQPPKLNLEHAFAARPQPSDQKVQHQCAAGVRGHAAVRVAPLRGRAASLTNTRVGIAKSGGGHLQLGEADAQAPCAPRQQRGAREQVGGHGRNRRPRSHLAPG